MANHLLPLLLSAILTLLILAGGVFLIWVVWRFLHVKQDREHAFTIDNLGNCRQIYHLSVNSPEPALKFTLLFNHIPLAQVVDPVEEMEVEEAAPRESVQPVPAQASAPVGQSGGMLAAPGQAVASSTGKLASILNELGAYLPGAAGRRMEEAANKSRGVQMKSLRVVRGEQKLQRKAGELQHRGQAGPTRAPGRAASTPGRLTYARGRVTSSQGAPGPAILQTPELVSGQSLTLALRIGSNRRRYPHGSFAYTVQAQPAAVDFPDVHMVPVIKNGTVHFAPVSWWRYALPVLCSALVVLLVMFVLALAFAWVW